MPAPRVTTDEYFRMPETVRPQELVYGLVRDAPAPPPMHQWTVGAVYRHLYEHVEAPGRGSVWLSPIDVVLDRERALVVQPDVIVVMKEHQHIVRDRVWGVPDLVVEVLSPHPRIGRLEERLEWFAQYGVRECWLVLEGARQIEVISYADGRISRRTLVAPRERIRSEVLPTIDLRPADVMPAP